MSGGPTRFQGAGYAAAHGRGPGQALWCLAVHGHAGTAHPGHRKPSRAASSGSEGAPGLALPATSPFIPTDAKIVVGAVAPASPDPIPIVLVPGFEYRMREWRHPDTHEVHWRLERRRSAQHGDHDD